MRRRLPPLSSLLAFETVAELGSFSRAGESLSLTHSAISHQVKLLEEHVGMRLLDRQPRGVVLTPEGALYLAHVKRALSELEQGEAGLRRHADDRPLRIGVLPSFAGNVLLPRMASLLASNPGLRVEIDSTVGLEHDSASEVDVLIRYGTGDWPGFECTRLLDVTLFPVCSPAYLERHGPFDDLGDLSRAVLLRHTHEPWSNWFAEAGSRLPGYDASIIPAGPLYTDARLMLDAACEGQGIALARSVLAAADLRQGRLVRLLGVEVDSPRAYHVLVRPGAGRRPRLARFLAWLDATFCVPSAAKPPPGD
jgi:LysR family glycine cleavage system transcriptional activator